MKELITTYTKSTIEFHKLQALSTLLNYVSFEFDLKLRFDVQDIYFDFGQNWMYTTIICTDLIEMNKGNTVTSSYQFLNPREYEMLLSNGDDYMFELFKEKKERLFSRYC